MVSLRPTRQISAFTIAAVLSIGSATAQNIVTRGTRLGGSPAIGLDEAVEQADQYADRLLTLEGEVKRVCQVKGCWMELVRPGDDRGIRGLSETTPSSSPRTQPDNELASKAAWKRTSSPKPTRITSSPRVSHCLETLTARQPK